MELRATALWMSGVGPEAEGRVEFTILLERAISGDVSAFEQIILRYERRVFSLAWRLLGRPEDAQDASQDVFLRAFRYLHRFDRRRPFEPWLMIRIMNSTRNSRGRSCIERFNSCRRKSGPPLCSETSKVCRRPKLPRS